MNDELIREAAEAMFGLWLTRNGSAVEKLAGLQKNTVRNRTEKYGIPEKDLHGYWKKLQDATGQTEKSAFFSFFWLFRKDLSYISKKIVAFYQKICYNVSHRGMA